MYIWDDLLYLYLLFPHLKKINNQRLISTKIINISLISHIFGGILIGYCPYIWGDFYWILPVYLEEYLLDISRIFGGILIGYCPYIWGDFYWILPVYLGEYLLDIARILGETFIGYIPYIGGDYL